MKQIFHPYWEWEDFTHGMWRKESAANEKELLGKAIQFTGNYLLYGSFMRKVIDLWPISCEHNLTDLGQNRRAWIGHAATLIAINCPEYITREAWGYLTKKQQDDANEQADIAIAIWEKTHGINGGEYAQMFFEY